MKELITQDQQGNLTVTSLVISKLFDRRHSDVLKSIDKVSIQLQQVKAEREIAFSEYKDSSGKSNRFATLTEDQFLVAMPFIGGEKSFEGQYRLVQEFRKLRDILSNKNRHIDAIRNLLLLDVPSTWEKLYPDDFFVAIMNLHGHKFNGNSSTPLYCANIIRRWVYDIVLPQELNFEIDTKRGLEKKHTWFNKDGGRSTLLAQISKVEMVARMSQSRVDFEHNCATAFLGEPLQLSIFK